MMNTTSPSPELETSTLPRAYSDFVRHWSGNMNLVHQWGIHEWPGFRYTPEERDQMKKMADETRPLEFWTWLHSAAFVSILFFAVVVGIGFMGLNAVYGKDPSKTPSVIFFVMLGMEAAICFSVAMPLAMLLTSAVVGRIFAKDAPPVPPASITVPLWHKIHKQFIRFALVSSSLLVIGILASPPGSLLDTLLKMVLPLLGPALTLSYIVLFISRFGQRR